MRSLIVLLNTGRWIGIKLYDGYDKLTPEFLFTDKLDRLAITMNYPGDLFLDFKKPTNITLTLDSNRAVHTATLIQETGDKRVKVSYKF